MKLVIIESPYAAATPAGIARNVQYARACVANSLARGEAPFASHLLYTQDGVLDDDVREQRLLGINAGLAWGASASLTAVYTELGISTGMQMGIDRAIGDGRQVVYRQLGGIWANVGWGL